MAISFRRKGTFLGPPGTAAGIAAGLQSGLRAFGNVQQLQIQQQQANQLAELRRLKIEAAQRELDPQPLELGKVQSGLRSLGLMEQAEPQGLVPKGTADMTRKSVQKQMDKAFGEVTNQAGLDQLNKANNALELQLNAPSRTLFNKLAGGALSADRLASQLRSRESIAGAGLRSTETRAEKANRLKQELGDLGFDMRKLEEAGRSGRAKLQAETKLGVARIGAAAKKKGKKIEVDTTRLQ